MLADQGHLSRDSLEDPTLFFSVDTTGRDKEV
jgi:hypothetical protein